MEDRITLGLGAMPLAPPSAMAGVDLTGDGRANFVYVGADTNRDGIPDALQRSSPSPPRVRDRNSSGQPLNAPLAAAGVDTTGDGLANFVYVGADEDRDGV